MRLTEILLGIVLALHVGVIVAGEAPKQPAQRKAVTALPAIPAPLHDALAGRQFAEAVRLIDAESKKAKPAHPDYLLYLKGRALAELKSFEAALSAFTLLEEKHPKSRWLSRSRFGRADVLVRTRDYRAAGRIYEAEARRLLSDGRKDELVALYLEFADRYFQGVPAKGPAPEKKPDFKQALGYYRQALGLNPSLSRRQRIELRIARCLQESKKLAESIAAYETFLKTHASDETKKDHRAPADMEVEARFQLGRAQLAASQPAEARKTWQDFLTNEVVRESGGDLRAEAAYRLASTHGVPAPGSIGDLELGVAALEKFLTDWPKHRLAAKAEYEIAQSYAHHGRYEQAIGRLESLIANKAYQSSEQIAEARKLLGQSYSAQKKFSEAIAAWREFLDKHPTNQSWSQVQRMVVDTEYAAAEEQRRQKNYDAARKLWATFLNKYPLDARAPRILFQFGQMKYAAAVARQKEEGAMQGRPDAGKKLSGACRKLFQEAIADWKRLGSKYPQANEASQAAYMIGVTLEDKLGRLAEALEAYKKVKKSYGKSARQRVANLTAKRLELLTERKFRSNEKPVLKLTTRNIEKLSVKLYRIDMPDYFRKMHLASGVETLDIALIDPDKSWEYEVAGYEKYRRLENRIEIPVEGPGVTAVTVSSDKLEATTMIVVSDLDVIVKSSRNELFVFAENMLARKPAEGVSLLVSDGKEVFAEEVTGKDGILQKSYKQLKTVTDLRVFAVHEGHAASTVGNLTGLNFAVGLSPKGFLYTDRPAYRAGQLVHLKGVIRWVDEDRYTFKAGETYQLDVYDSRGRVIHTKKVSLNKFGTLADHFTLPETSPQGGYRIHVHQPGRSQSYESRFQVHEYKLEPVEIVVDVPRQVYYRREKIEGTIKLRYYYGTPLSGRTIQYRLADDRLHTAQTDAKGEVKFEFPTSRYSESQVLPLIVRYPERNLAVAKQLFLATRGFVVGVSTLRSVQIAGETFDATVTVSDPAGKPLAVDLKLEVFEESRVDNRRGERLIATHQIKSDKTGEARQTLGIEKPGHHIIRVTGTDRFGNPVSGQHRVYISGNEDKVRLRILAESHHYNVGDTAKLRLHWRDEPALALVTYEGAKVLGYRIVPLKKGANPLAIPMESHLAPNFVLGVAVMDGNRFHRASSEFRLTRKLNITLKPDKTTLEPGDELKVDITATDPQGKPISAELSLALIQKSLLDRFPGNRGVVDQFFGGGYRKPSVRAATSCTFRYQPQTRGISRFLLAEEERKRTRESDLKALAVLHAGIVGSVVVDESRRSTTEEALVRDSNADGLGDLVPLYNKLFQNKRYAEAEVVAKQAAERDPGNPVAVTMQWKAKFARRVARQGELADLNDGLWVRTMQNVDAGMVLQEQLRERLEAGRHGHGPSYRQARRAAENGNGNADFTRIAGPIGRNLRGIRGLNLNGNSNAFDLFLQQERGGEQAAQQVEVQMQQMNNAPVEGNGAATLTNGGLFGLQRGSGSQANFNDLVELIQQETGGPWETVNGNGSLDISEYETTLSLSIRQSQSLQGGTLHIPIQVFNEISNSGGTIVGLNSAGEFQVVNGLPVAQLKTWVEEGGLQLLPHLATSETGFWDPVIVTGKDGKATATFRLPGRSTAWKLQSTGVDAETLSGQADVEIVAKKDLFGQLKTPLAFTAGDKAQLIVEVHNSIVKKDAKISVVLKTTIGERTTELKKTITSKGPGIEEVTFPAEITAGETAEFELTVSGQSHGAQPVGLLSDVVKVTVPIKPFGIPVFATTSGSSAQSTIVFVEHDKKLPVQDPHLEIIIGPSIDRTLLDAVLGGGLSVCERSSVLPRSGLERAISDSLGGVALLGMVGASRSTDSPEAQALAARVQSAVAQLVSAQRDDGGWSWSGRPGKSKSDPKRGADRYLSSRAVWALASARRSGFAVPQETFDKAVVFLKSVFAAAGQSDREGQAIILHGMTEADAGHSAPQWGFAFANRLYRERNNLSPSGLLHVALVLARMDRKEMAKELLPLVKISIDAKTAGKQNGDAAVGNVIPWMQGGVELRALYLLAVQAVSPGDAKAGRLADWLLAARRGSRWTPEKANGPAVAALAEWFARTKHTDEKYELSIFVNDRLVEKIDVDPASDASRRLEIPRKMLVAGKKGTPGGGPQQINFDMEGRGRFSYSVVLGGFVPAEKLASTTNSWRVKRTYEPQERMLDGQVVPRGFGILAGTYSTFKNPLTQLPMGKRGEVTLEIHRHRTGIAGTRSTKDEPLDYLIVTEPIPAGTMVLRESIRGSFERYEISPGAVTFYIGDRRHPGAIRYTLAGYLPGGYRAAPTVVRSFYRPERIAVAESKSIEVLARGGKSKDGYKLTPVELFEFGKRHLAKRDYEAANGYLKELFRDYRLLDKPYQDLVQSLFQTALATNKHAETVEYFEIIKEKYPEVEIDFPSILKVGKAYRELGEYERSYLVYRATVEAGFLRESQIAGFLDERGEFLRSVQVMERLLAEYPAESYIATAAYALAQEVYGKAAEAPGDRKLREAQVGRVDLIATSIRMLDHFVSTWPNDPAADQASFSVATALLDLEQFDEAISRCGKFAQRYPESKLLDSFWYVIGYSQFALGQHEKALAMCRKVAETKRKDPRTGVEIAAANKWQAIYIMGQVYHSLGKPAEAIDEYERVKSRFADAMEAIEFFSRKDIRLPEVTTVKPGEPAKVPLKFRNVAAANVKVYRIDLLKFGLMQRNLNRITAINLAGIRPYHELTLKLGDGKDYRDREQPLALPLKEEGAYLVVCRGENIYTSGLVLVSPLALDVQEDATSGRVRVTVKNTVDDRYAHDVHVKVIGSNNDKFTSGQTDLRGLFIADAIRGTGTVIAKSGDETDRYAFYRGKKVLGQPVPAAASPKSGQTKGKKKSAASKNGGVELLRNIIDTNSFNNGTQRENYRELLNNSETGVKAKAAF